LMEGPRRRDPSIPHSGNPPNPRPPGVIKGEVATAGEIPRVIEAVAEISNRPRDGSPADRWGPGGVGSG